MADLDFVVLGLAHCFMRDEENQLVPVQVIEPIPSASFLTLVQDIPSSYSRLVACNATQVLDTDGNVSVPDVFPKEAKLAQDFNERLEAAARTFQHHPEAKIWQVGQPEALNQKSSQKRVLNATNNVSEQDNVKQHPLTHTTL